MKLVILDRDGVINYDSPSYIKSPEEWKPIPGSLEAIARLTQGGHHVVVATNQSGIARGLFDMAALNAIHDRMHRALGQVGGRIDAVFFCPHAGEAKCRCRKPEAGLLEDISHRFNVNLKGVPSIDGILDFPASPQRGLGLQDVVVTRWDPAKHTWVAVRQPGGQPLQ
jgi:D-glycero-D-manno-heptose 1,7-bisphosphate phosphatase